jgi:3-polyprenyl-4-hydroxybenzoate decarboxylase
VSPLKLRDVLVPLKPNKERVSRLTSAATIVYVLDHATSEIAVGSNSGFDATKKLAGEGFKRPWPPLIKMDESVKVKVGKLLGARE